MSPFSSKSSRSTSEVTPCALTCTCARCCAGSPRRWRGSPREDAGWADACSVPGTPRPRPRRWSRRRAGVGTVIATSANRRSPCARAVMMPVRVQRLRPPTLSMPIGGSAMAPSGSPTTCWRLTSSCLRSERRRRRRGRAGSRGPRWCACAPRTGAGCPTGRVERRERPRRARGRLRGGRRGLGCRDCLRPRLLRKRYRGDSKQAIKTTLIASRITTAKHLRGHGRVQWRYFPKFVRKAPGKGRLFARFCNSGGQRERTSPMTPRLPGPSSPPPPFSLCRSQLSQSTAGSRRHRWQPVTTPHRWATADALQAAFAPSPSRSGRRWSILAPCRRPGPPPVGRAGAQRRRPILQGLLRPVLRPRGPGQREEVPDAGPSDPASSSTSALRLTHFHVVKAPTA